MTIFKSFYRGSKHSVLAVILAILSAPMLLSAQQVIPDHSTARLYLGSAENPKSVNVGVARVRGNVEVNPDDVSASRINFTIYAANQNTVANDKEIAGDQPTISFESKDVRERGDGTLEVKGKLTVTQVYRQEFTSLGEDYSGPTYGPPTFFRTSQEATFLFTPPKQSAPAAGPADARVVPAQSNLPQGGLELMATAKVNGEAFPELSQSIQEVAWPLAVDDEQCTAPATTGEDYSGANCTGTLHEPSPTPVLLVQPGEDYAGIQQVPPAGDQVTIQLDLSLSNTSVAQQKGQAKTDQAGQE